MINTEIRNGLYSLAYDTYRTNFKSLEADNLTEISAIIPIDLNNIQSFDISPSSDEMLARLLEVRKHASEFILKNYRKFLLKKKTKLYATIYKLIKLRELCAIKLQKHVRRFLVRKDLEFLKGIDHKRLVR